MSPIETIRKHFDAFSASEVADLLLSPHIHEKLLVDSTVEPGPSMWIINRSDVYDETLLAFSHHSIEGMALRAKQKWDSRHSSLMFLSPPEIEGPYQEIPDFLVEDVLGHPLAPFEAMLYFLNSLSDEVRMSACLSLTRRLVEHPPKWDQDLRLKLELVDRFGKTLVSDPSALVRSYACRIPIFETSLLSEALKREKESHVQMRLLQNPATSLEMIQFALEKLPDALHQRVAALDKRIPAELRKEVLKANSDELTHALHEWHLLIN